MGRSAEKIEIIVTCEPSEHERDAEMLRTLKQQVQFGVNVTQDLFPEYFIDTMGLD